MKGPLSLDINKLGWEKPNKWSLSSMTHHDKKLVQSLLLRSLLTCLAEGTGTPNTQSMVTLLLILFLHLQGHCKEAFPSTP